MNRCECDKCGACCNGSLIVEIEGIDLLREPRLIESDPHWQGQNIDIVLRELQGEFGKAVIIACGRPCAFLNAENHCSIYPTRPNACVGMEAGDEQCQNARERAGLPRLEPYKVGDLE